MPTGTQQISNKEVIETLHDVIESLIDGQEGFQNIGEHLKDETLKKYFLAESLKRSQFRGELETMLHTTGDHDPKKSGSVERRSSPRMGRYQGASGRRRSYLTRNSRARGRYCKEGL